MPTTMSLLDLAEQAAQRAYCPYSKFHVGAALEGSDGEIYTGCNVENASYGLTICAERNALFSMIAGGCRTFKMLAVVCPDAGPDVPANYRMPCGACRQVIAEFAAPDAIIVVGGVDAFSLNDLLPNAFKL